MPKNTDSPEIPPTTSTEAPAAPRKPRKKTLRVAVKDDAIAAEISRVATAVHMEPDQIVGLLLSKSAGHVGDEIKDLLSQQLLGLD